LSRGSTRRVIAFAPLKQLGALSERHEGDRAVRRRPQAVELELPTASERAVAETRAGVSRVNTRVLHIQGYVARVVASRLSDRAVAAPVRSKRKLRLCETYCDGAM
jgi:hypothetical protein